jgi:shikimate dehydrogenase
MRLFGLIGYPLGHSFSAAYFSKKFEKEGIDAEYRNFPLANMTGFRDLLESTPGLWGLNVTVPYKQAVIPYLHSLSSTAEAVQAVNTISFRERGGSLELEGDNTDVIGFRTSLEQHLRPRHTSALVLGTGGSSKAVRYTLDQLGILYTPVSRTPGPDRKTYGELDQEIIANNTLIINTTPLGMYPDILSYPDLPYDALTPEHLLFDLVYNPAKTAFLSRGEQQGAAGVNGYDMLVLQAEASWGIWNRD